MPRAKSGGTGDDLNATAHRCRGDTAVAEISRCNRRRHRPRYKPWRGSGQEIRTAKTPYAEQFTTWQLANAPIISTKITLTTSDIIKF